ncbi:TetR/AcrR family transcriptional regulator [Nonomuraea sp. NPDC048826]|uniref:TetR/AcrR family transcriptional regulator n=1 Tax=Nonomuraea sp. NPDC048826 TaxID=3364347 RepID=UPI0037176836
MARRRAFDRDEALDRALHAFWRHGYEVTSVAELTAVMGIRPPSLYAAFGDKQRLFEETLRRYQETYGAFTTRALAEEPTARQAVERILYEAAAEYTDPGHPHGCMVISAAVNCGPESSEVEERLRLARESAKAALRERVERDVTAGLLPPSTDAAALATYYAATIQGMSTQARDGAGRDELEQVAALAMRAWPEG